MHGHMSMLEKPRDPNVEPYPSFWRAADTVEATNKLAAVFAEADQCAYGAEVKKETSIWGTRSTVQRVARKCRCRSHKHIDLRKSRQMEGKCLPRRSGRDTQQILLEL